MFRINLTPKQISDQRPIPVRFRDFQSYIFTFNSIPESGLWKMYVRFGNEIDENCQEDWRLRHYLENLKVKSLEESQYEIVDVNGVQSPPLMFLNIDPLAMMWNGGSQNYGVYFLIKK